MLEAEEGGGEEEVYYNERRKQLDDLIAKVYQELETDEDIAKVEETLEVFRHEREQVYNLLREKGKGKASIRPRMSGLSSGVSSATARYMESFQVSWMYNNIMFLKEKAARLEAIIQTGERVDNEELETLASDVDPSSFPGSSAGVDEQAMLAALKGLIKEKEQEKAILKVHVRDEYKG